MKVSIPWLSVLVLVLILAPSVGQACRCIDQGPLCASFNHEAGTVFRGKVVELTLLRPAPQSVQNLDGTTSSIVQAGRYKVRFEVAEMFRGAPAAEFTVYTTEGGCGFPFSRGAQYVVFASPEGATGQLVTGLCSHTHELDPAQNDPDVAWMRGLATAPDGVSIFGSLLASTAGMNTPPRARVSVRGPLSRDLITGRNGAYRAARLPPGTYTVSVRMPPGFVTPPPETVRVENRGCAEVDWPVFYDIHVKGRVLSADGVPVAGIAVNLLKQDRDSARGYSEYGAGITDAQGQYSLDYAPPGTYFVVTNSFGPMPTSPYTSTYFPSAGTLEQAAPVKLVPSLTLEDIDIHLPKALLAVHVNATVKLQDGSAAGHALVKATDIGAGGPPFTGNGVVEQADVNGQASLPLFAWRAYYLTAWVEAGTQQRCGGPLKFIAQDGMQLEDIVIEHNWGNCLAQLNPQFQAPK
jgi:hypothetical protein